MSAYGEAVKALPNLGAFWPLDNASGVTDQSGNGRNGTGVGSISIGGHEASPIIGETHSTDFSGAGQYISTTYQPYANGTTRAVGGWFWSDTSARLQELWTTDPNNVVYAPRIHTDSSGGGHQANGLYFSPNWATTDTQWAGGIPGTEQWIFLVIVFNESTNAVTAYVNGEALEAKTNAGQYTVGKNFRIGASTTGANQDFDGKMAGLFVVEGNVTAEQVAALYAAATAKTLERSASVSAAGSIAASGTVVAGEPLPMRRKPPLELDVEVETPHGTFRLASDDPKAKNRPQGLGFSTQRGDGFATGGAQLTRAIFKDYPDLGLLDTWRFVGRNGDVAYEGRMHSNPRTNDPRQQIDVSLVGWMTYLKGRKIAPLIIDRRLGSWTEPNITMVAEWLGENKRFFGPSNHGGSSPSIRLSITEPWKVGARSASIFYAGGEQIGELRYSRKKLSGVGEFLWSARIMTGDTLATTVAEDTSTLASAATNDAVAAEGSYVEIEIRNDSEKVGTSTETADQWYDIRVFGTHGLTKQGEQPNEGFYISDIIEWLLETYYPKIDTSGIQTNSFPVTQAAWHDNPGDGWTIIQELNNLAVWETSVWENRTFHFGPADLTKHDWQIRTDQHGVSVGLQGDSIENFANGVAVTYTDFFGTTQTLYPPDHEELRDDSESNPANKHGEYQWIPDGFTVPSPCGEAEALQLGRAYLAEWNRPKRPGQFRVTGHIEDSAGNWHQGWKVRAGETIALLDHPNESPRLIYATDWDQESKTLTVTVDATPKTLEAVLARQERARTARNL